jgi:glycosyltransferase involved in cell wall biosynthesis
MKNKKILTVTVGMPALNESKTIVRALNSILKQKELGFKLKKIIVISDGSIDNTANRANTIDDNRINVIKDKSNKGRVARWNQLFSLTSTDILLFMDADEELVDPYSIAKVISEFSSESNVHLVGGNPYSVDDGSFLSGCLKVTRDAFTDLRYKINNGNNIYGCMGGFLALSKTLYSNLVIPNDILANDSYVYMECIKSGYKFKNVKDIKIPHYLHYSIRGLISRNNRHAKAKDELIKYFGNMVHQERLIPKKYYRLAVFRQFMSHPVFSVGAFVINKYAAITAK